MELKKYDNCVTIDGRLDEPVWDTAEVYSGLKTFRGQNSQPIPVETTFKILQFEDRVIIGAKCMETDMATVVKNHVLHSLWTNDAIELFLSPTGNSFEFYQYVISVGNQRASMFYSEAGQIQPDPYAPDWKTAVYHGEDFWSVEVELPLIAFYMTDNDAWRSKWRVNFCRDRVNQTSGSCNYYTWSDMDDGYFQSTNFRFIDGFPMRPKANSVQISEASLNIAGRGETGFVGTMTVKTVNPETAEFEFSSSATETRIVKLNAGVNEITVPCAFESDGRKRVMLQLKRLSDGLVFKRWYPVRVDYEDIRMEFTLPEYRNNFYPGQDYSKVVGKVTAAKPVTLKLEGPGIPTTELTPDAEGNFVFETPDFEIGTAWLTATIEGCELKKKIRRLAPTGRQMSWISGGNLVVDGEPVLRRNMYAEYYRGGAAFDRRYDADDLHQTKKIRGNVGHMGPDYTLQQLGMSVAETKTDVKPCKTVFDKIDEIMESHKGKDFTYYYLSDEPECRGLSPIYLRYLYEYIADKDPYHVVLMACRAADRYQICSDWLETHPYINPQESPEKGRYYGRPIHSVGSFVDCAAKLNRPDKCIGFLPTCFAYKWSNIYSDYPNFEEMVCHTWAAMLPGGKTLWPYAYHDLNDRASLYEGTRYIFSSFEALDQLILFAKRTDLVKNQQVHAVLYELNDEKMFAVANMTREPQKVTLDGISGTWHEFRHNRTISGNTFELKPLEVLIGTTEVKDAGLPTYEETAALIDKLEYERTHRGSLLFDRHHDIPVTTSARSGGTRYKMFDGILDNHGWEDVGDKDKFYEIDLTKVQPTFQKVIVYGYNVDTMELKVRNGGELSVPPIAEVRKEEFSTTFLLNKAICPEGLRLEFNAHKVELYEIEVF